MTNYWAIAIGINEYQHCQPLPNTKSDVVALRNFWVNEAKFASDQCVLLTDASSTPDASTPDASTPDVKAIHPSQKNIHTWIARFSQEVKSDDFLWCFFRGYGIQFEGKDYLLPIDGNPDQLPSTGIPIESLFGDLRSAATGNILLVLEIHPSQSNRKDNLFGAQAVKLAEEYKITTILSHFPARFSKEMPAVDQDLTGALLEGMHHHNCTTLDQLIQYLSNRMPKLSISNWHVGQNSAAIVPQIQRHQGTLPDTSGTSQQSEQIDPTELDLKEPSTNNWVDRPFQILLLGGMIATIGATLFHRYGERIGSPFLKLPEFANQYFPSKEAKSEDSSGTKPDQAKQDDQSKAQPTSPSQPSPETIAALESARNALQARQHEQALNILDQIPESQRSDECNQLRQQVSQGLLNEARALINQVGESTHVNQATNFSQAITKARAIRPGAPLYVQAQKDIERWSQVILDLAQGRANQSNYDAAISAAQLISSNQKSLYPAAQESISQWQKAKANQAILEQAKLSIRRFQAPSYSQAIATVLSIQPDQPLHKEAQTLTKEWSQSILTIARAHAVQGEFAEAMQTARLVPQSTPAYQEAKTAIDQWQSEPNKQ